MFCCAPMDGGFTFRSFGCRAVICIYVCDCLFYVFYSMCVCDDTTAFLLHSLRVAEESTNTFGQIKLSSAREVQVG